VATFGNNASLQSLVTLSVAVIALFVAALSPLLLLKFAPVIPVSFGGTSGPALSTSSIGARNMSDAGSRFDRNPSGGRSSSSGGSSSGRNAGGEAATVAVEQKTLAGVSAARAGTSAAAGPAGGAAAAGAATATAAEGLAAAGAAESATGVGAAIGIPTLVVAAGAMAATQGLKVTEAAGQQAAAAMDDSTIGAERTT
jgi:type IV secretion system protein TrbL